MCGNLESVELLVRHGAEIDEVDSQGRTPLIQASSEGQLEIAQSLVAAGADVNHADEDAQNCCHWAFMMDHTDLGDWLVEETTVDTAALDSEGRSPLHWRDGEDVNAGDVAAESKSEESKSGDGDGRAPVAAGFVINATIDGVVAAGTGLRATRWLRQNSSAEVVASCDGAS